MRKKKIRLSGVFILALFFLTSVCAGLPPDACLIKPKVVKVKVVKRPLIVRPVIPVYRAVLYPGSLKYNIVRIAQSYGWSTVVWNAPEDYLWIGRTQITTHNLVALFNKVLSGYPVQARFYKGNHVLAIVPRNLP